MKIKTFTKIVSSILCAALTMQIGWGVTQKQAHADVAGTITVSGNNVTLTGPANNNDHVPFDISAKDGGGYVITSMDQTQVVDSIDNLTVNDRHANINFQTDVTIGSLSLTNLNSLMIPSGKTVTIGSFGRLNGNIVISGTLITNDFKTSNTGLNYIGLQIRYGATIKADNIELTGTNNTTYENANYYPTNSFTIGSASRSGTVYAQPETKMTSSGGGYKLVVNGCQTNVTGSYSNKQAYDLLPDPNLTFAGLGDVYYGQNYDMGDLLTAVNGYDLSNVEIQYANSQRTIIEKPTAVGEDYAVRAVAPYTSSYKGVTTSWQSFDIVYLPLDDLGLTSPYVSVSGIVNGKYIPGDLTVTAPDDILLGSTTIPDVTGFSSSLTLTGEQLANDLGKINEDIGLVLQNSEGAMTDDIALDILYPDITNYVFDLYDPDIWVGSVDGEEVDLDDDELERVTGDEAEIYIFDDNIKAVYINGTLYQNYPEFYFSDDEPLDNDIANGYIALTFESVADEAKEYTIKAVDYANKETELSFTLYPNVVDGTISVTVPGTIYAGDDYKVTTNTNSDGNVTLQYKDAGTGEVLTSKPTVAGSYIVTATAAETDFYSEAKDSKNYTIIKRTPVNTLSVPDVTYSGDYYNVEFKTDSDGEVTYQYFDKNNDSYLDTKPTSAGEYIVIVTTAETVKYYGSEKTATIKIIKRTPDTTVSVSDVVYVGDNYNVAVDTDSNGNVYYQYYDKTNGSYLDGKPTSAGEYTVTVTTSETALYYESEDTATFKIIKRDPTISLSVPDTVVGQTYSPVLETDSDSKSITYEYKVEGAADSTYTKTKPTAAGSYTARVTIGITNKFNEGSDTADFKISKKTPSVSLGVGTPYAGTTYTPSFTSNSDAASRAVFEYKEKNADDSKYSKTAPDKVGTYVVRVTIPETDTFAKATATADFRIIYLDAPQTSYVIEGQPGKNNYYVSDVVLKAPTGFTISAVYGGTYTPSIPYKDGITSVYLKRNSDNALTTAIPIVNAPRVDKSAPSISTPNGAIAPGSVIYTSDFTVNISDPNLRSLKVNGQAVDLSNNKDGYTLTLNPGFGSETYKVMAEDEAGNVTTLEFTLKAEWLKDKVIIPDVVLPLEGNESYNLGDGYWLVTRNTPEGPVTDKTVYSGNMPFYVTEGGEYTFTKVT